MIINELIIEDPTEIEREKRYIERQKLEQDYIEKERIKKKECWDKINKEKNKTKKSL